MSTADRAPSAELAETLARTLPGATPDVAVAPALRLLAESLRQRMFQSTPEPVRFGRYTLLERVGEGGMGVVFAAYDDALDRKVAIKIQRAGDRDAHAQARLAREAQALAQLSHPNVVQVFDVGALDDQVFLAMEFVRGATLARWCRAAPRSRAAVLDVLLQAGRGLAAAHAAGIVHRDFKPENVLVGDDGRARVADFGLARAGDGPPADVAAATSPGGLTMTGLMIGTPAYMSPEQFRGARTVDARSDQFSFCTVAWECLHGERPFAGDDVATIRAAVLAGRVRQPSPQVRVPGRLTRILLRGLQLDPSDRWPAMDALLAELAPPARARRTAIVGGLAVAAAAGLLAALVVTRDDPAAHCPAGAAERVAAVWDGPARAAVRAGLTAVDAPFARDVAPRVEAAVDRYTAGVAASLADACVATARGEQSSALLDLRVACLRGQLRELGALLRLFARADVGAAARALGAVDGLPSPQRCGPELVGAEAPPARPAEVDAVRGELARAAAELRAGDYASGLRIVDAAASAAAALDHPPLTGEALLLRGLLASKAGAFDDAERALVEAMLAARRARAPELAGRIAVARVELAQARHDHDDVPIWLDMAAADLGPNPPDPALRILLLGRRSRESVALEADALDQGALLRTVAEAEQVLGPDHTRTIQLLRDTAKALWGRAHYEPAEPLLDRAYAASVRAYGPDHPETGLTMLDVAKLAWVRGDYVRALGVQLQALTLLIASLGERNADVGLAMNDIGATLGMAGDTLAAEPWFQAAFTAYEASLGAGSVLGALALDNLALATLERGDLDESLRLTRRAAAIRRAIFKPGHTEVARSHLALGERLFLLGDLAGSLDEYEQALALRSGLALHRVLLARAQYGLARALHAEGRDSERAVSLAREAVHNFRAHAQPSRELPDAEALLRTLEAAGRRSDAPRN